MLGNSRLEQVALQKKMEHIFVHDSTIVNSFCEQKIIVTDEVLIRCILEFAVKHRHHMPSACSVTPVDTFIPRNVINKMKAEDEEMDRSGEFKEN